MVKWLTPSPSQHLCLLRLRIGTSQKPVYQKYEVQNREAKSSQSEIIMKTKNQNSRQNRQGLGRIGIVNKGVSCTISQKADFHKSAQNNSVK